MTTETHHPPSSNAWHDKSIITIVLQRGHLWQEGQQRPTSTMTQAQECSRRDQALVVMSPTYDGNDQPDVPNPVMTLLEEGDVGMERELV